MSPQWIGTIAAVGSLVLALVTIATARGVILARWVWGVFKRIEQLIEDFNGAPARPGVPGRKGVLERLEVIESELSYNSGSTVKDAVRRIDHNVADIARTQNTEPQVQVNVHP